MAYKDIIETSNTDLILDGMKQLAVVSATANKTFTGVALVFSAPAGVNTITATGLGTAISAIGDQIIIKGSVDTTGLINNDGIYTVVTTAANVLTVAELVTPAASVSTANTVDEIDTFVLHPTRRTGQICVFVINSAANNPTISFKPGGYWAAKIEKGLPKIQGTPLGATSNLFQVETAPYLQTEEKILTGTVQQKGSILMRMIPAASTSGATVKVGFIQLA